LYDRDARHSIDRYTWNIVILHSNEHLLHARHELQSECMDRCSAQKSKDRYTWIIVIHTSDVYLPYQGDGFAGRNMDAWIYVQCENQGGKAMKFNVLD
jgi:hypothetical protein